MHIEMLEFVVTNSRCHDKRETKGEFSYGVQLLRQIDRQRIRGKIILVSRFTSPACQGVHDGLRDGTSVYASPYTSRAKLVPIRLVKLGKSLMVRHNSKSISL